MKTILRPPSRYLAVTAAALAIVFGTAYAAAPGMPPAGPDAPAAPGSHPGPDWQHGHDRHMMERLNALHDKLKLDTDQEQKWQTAVQTMKRNHEAQRANRDKMREQFQTARQQPILDLDALHSSHRQFEQQNLQLREQTTSTWLAAYDSLNDQQKTLASTALKQHFAKMEERHERMRRHWEHRRGGEDASKPTAP